MSDYKKMYFELAAAVSNSIDQLQQAMQKTEERYIAKGDYGPDTIYRMPPKDKNSEENPQ